MDQDVDNLILKVTFTKYVCYHWLLPVSQELYPVAP